MIDPHTLVRRWFDEVWNQGREETVDELFAKDAIGHGLSETDTDVHGPEEFKVFLRNMRNAFPDIHMDVHDALSEGEKVAVRLTFTGTHRGDGLGFPATGKNVRVAGVIMARLENGQIAEVWNCWDQHGMLQQLGTKERPANDRFLAGV